MVKHIDNLSETSDSLRSQTHIMSNSLHTALSEKIDRELKATKEVSNNYESLKAELETKLETVIAETEELRGSIDKNMEGARRRVRHISDDDESDAESEPHPSVSRLDKLSTEIEKLKEDCYKLDCRIIETEQYPRRESLVFHGIPASIPQKDLERTVFDILLNLGFEIHRDDICRFHRLWSPPNSREPAPVIVKFFNSKIVNWSLSHPEDLENVKNVMGLDLTMS